VIRSFGNKDTEHLWRRDRVKGIDPRVQQAALRKLRIIGSAVELAELRIPPGNRLESLKGDRSGQYSIRVNDQWRICFEWSDGGAENVELVDYH
jgi:proteic killer suppression protein